MYRAHDLLRTALAALNSQPRFTFGYSDSYELAAGIENYLRERGALSPPKQDEPRGCASGSTGYIGYTE